MHFVISARQNNSHILKLISTKINILDLVERIQSKTSSEETRLAIIYQIKNC